MKSGEWRMYGAEIAEGLAVYEDDGSPCPAWRHVLIRNFRDTPRQESVGVGGFGGREGPAATLPLIATWDHEPTDEEVKAATPEDYR